MNKIIYIISTSLFLIQACAQDKEVNQTKFQLKDYISDNKDLDNKVEEIFLNLDDTSIVAQLIMPAVGRYGQTEETIKKHINSRIIGVVLMLN